MGSGGENPLPLTSTPTDDREPAFSPDGSQIVFEASRGRLQPDLRRPRRRRGQPDPLTVGPGYQDTIPASRPTDRGSCSTAIATGALAVMNADGSGIQPLTTPADSGAIPDWQPLNPPAVDVTAGEQKSPKQVTVTVVSQNENASATLDGTLKAPKPKAAASKKKTVELDAVTVQLQPGVPQTVEIPVAGKGKKLIKKRSRAGKKPKGTVTATATDDLGAASSDALRSQVQEEEVKRARTRHAIALAVLGTAGARRTAAFPGRNGQIAFERDSCPPVERRPRSSRWARRARTRCRSRTNPDNDLDPSYSADGERIAFARSAGRRRSGS